MNTNLVHIIKQITAEYGEAVLANPVRLKAFFSDLAKDEPKPLRIAFGRCIEAGAYTALKTAPDTAERAEHKAAIAQRLRDEHGLDVTLCGEALDILEAALYGVQSAMPRQQPVQPQPPVWQTASAPQTTPVWQTTPARQTAPAPRAAAEFTPNPASRRNRAWVFLLVIGALVGLIALVKSANEASYSASNQLSMLESEFSALFNQGVNHYNRKEYDQAIASFDQALQIYPNRAPALAYRGGSYRYKGNNNAAITDCTAALEIEPQNAIAYFHRGSAYYLSGKNNQAIEDLTEAIRLDSANADAYNNRGGAYRNIGEYNRAIADYTEGLRIAPNDAIIKNNLADVRNRQARAQIVSSLNITSMRAGNWNNDWITRPGGTLYASEVYRLKIMVNYKTSINGSVILNVKWYYPGNVLRRWEDDAPSGYTYSINRSISTTGGEFDLGNWGWDEPGNFPRGTHKIELWYRDVLLDAVNVELR